MGVKQAEKMADWIIENYKIDKIYSSDLSRTYYTAKPISEKLNIEIIKNEKFREVYGGKWHDEIYDTIKEKYADDYLVWHNDMGNARCTDGESIKELSERMYNEISRLGEIEYGNRV